ncbi:oxidoreductase [Glutamicibacter uratoxydans]|uniref:Oxidoreductase n=1 Tax=Glutamicibacter uratoxydans TaxID=43667 RepID=A0A4Y4DT09_GLUUR|nr:NADP-dependent oxidoreductase [Glutamicibacter uratoxydans]GED07767.1 oxidoreductase [Glutamicibacter uratoxydans]
MHKAVIYRRFGDSGVLEIVDQLMPEPGPGMVRVRVEYTSVNPVDVKYRMGVLSDSAELAQPAMTGMDLAGVVDAVGTDVEGLSVGDRVAGMAPAGSNAEYVATYAAALTKVPESLDLKLAATIGVGGSTAVRALGLSKVTTGDLIFVDGATGGVGTFLTQLALSAGLKVVATASSRNQDYLASLGAIAIDYAGDWEAEAAAAADGATYAAAFDLSTGGKFEALKRLTGNAAKVVTLVDPAVMQGGGILVLGTEPGFDGALTQVIEAVATRKVVVPVAAEFQLADIAKAQDLVSGGHVRGKVIVKVSQ